MIRTPYIDAYNHPNDDLLCTFDSRRVLPHPRIELLLTRPSLPDHACNITIWSNVETAVGLIAGSLPALRQMVMRRRAARAHTYGTEGSNAFNTAAGMQFDTVKSKGIKSNFDIEENQQGYWTLGEGDTNSDTVPIRGIRKDTTFEVEMSSLHSNAKAPGGR